MAAVLTVWGLAHFFGIGFGADVILLIVGAAALGGLAVQAAKEISAFISILSSAKEDKDIDSAGTHLSTAVTIIGVQVVLMILLKKRPTTFDNAPAIRVSGGPTIPGTVKYTPKITRTPPTPGDTSMGYTTVWGDININSTLTKAEQRATLYHELVHSVLSPKLYFLRNIRAATAHNAYAKSHLLRFIEEAMCEIFTLLRTRGFSKQAVFDGITFPIAGQYTAISALGTEATGILLGRINAGGMIYKVYTGRAKK